MCKCTSIISPSENFFYPVYLKVLSVKAAWGLFIYHLRKVCRKPNISLPPDTYKYVCVSGGKKC